MKNLLIWLFGKAYMRWEGRQGIKEQMFLMRLNIEVAQDSFKELNRQIGELKEEQRAYDSHNKRYRELAGQIDGLEEQRKQAETKLTEHRQMLVNLDYKMALLKRV